MPSDAGNGVDRKREATQSRLEQIGGHLIPPDDGVSWEHAIATIKAQQKDIRTPNSEANPGYVRQVKAGKLWVHDRITKLLDPNSFREIGSLTGKPILDPDTGKVVGLNPGNIVVGWGKMDGRKVVITADDFSLRGGHADGGVEGKGPYAEELARKSRVPLVRLLDGSSGGGSVLKYLETGFMYVAVLAGLGQSLDTMDAVPVANALLGPVVGLGAAKAVVGHFSVMVKDTSQLFSAGPPLVKHATFEDVSKESLGGWQIHATNGSVDNLALSEQDAFDQIKRFLSYLPSSVFSLPPIEKSEDLPHRREEALISIIPRRRGQQYDIRKLIGLIIDQRPDVGRNALKTTFFELGSLWGRTVVTGLARLDGKPIGVLSSDCTVNGGALDANGSRKMTRFIDLCDHFGIPILNLVDMPGFAIGSVAERDAVIRQGASAISALYHATVPVFTVIIRRCFGIAGGAIADSEDGKNTRVAWPSGDWGSLPLEGGVEAAHKRQLVSAKSPEEREAMLTELLQKYQDIRSPLNTANHFSIEEIIDPRDTRPLAYQWISNVYEQVLPQRLAARQSIAGVDGRIRLPRGFRP